MLISNPSNLTVIELSHVSWGRNLFFGVSPSESVVAGDYIILKVEFYREFEANESVFGLVLRDCGGYTSKPKDEALIIHKPSKRIMKIQERIFNYEKPKEWEAVNLMLRFFRGGEVPAFAYNDNSISATKPYRVYSSYDKMFEAAMASGKTSFRLDLSRRPSGVPVLMFLGTDEKASLLHLGGNL